MYGFYKKSIFSTEGLQLMVKVIQYSKIQWIKTFKIWPWLCVCVLLFNKQIKIDMWTVALLGEKSEITIFLSKFFSQVVKKNQSVHPSVLFLLNDIKQKANTCS